MMKPKPKKKNGNDAFVKAIKDAAAKEEKREKKPEESPVILGFKDVYEKMMILNRAICVLTKSLNENGVLTPEQVKQIQLTLLDALSNEDERIKAKRDVITAHAGIKKVERDPEVEK